MIAVLGLLKGWIIYQERRWFYQFGVFGFLAPHNFYCRSWRPAIKDAIKDAAHCVVMYPDPFSKDQTVGLPSHGHQRSKTVGCINLSSTDSQFWVLCYSIRKQTKIMGQWRR